MKIGAIIAVAIAALGFLSAFVVFGDNKDNAQKEIIVNIRSSIELYDNKKMYADAVQKYKELVAADGCYDTVIEYRDYCMEHGFSSEYASACVMAINIRNNDFESSVGYLNFLIENNSKEIYSYVKKRINALEGENAQYFSDYYDSIKGRYKTLPGRYSEVRDWHNNYILTYDANGNTRLIGGSEVYTLALTQSGATCAINSSGNVIAQVKDTDVFSYSMSENLFAAIHESQAVYINTKIQRKIVPYNYGNHTLINYDYLGPFSGGYANYSNGGVWGYLDKNAEVKINGFEYASPFVNGVAAVRKDGKYGFIKYSSGSIIELTGYVYDDIYFDEYGYPFSYGCAYVKINGSSQWTQTFVKLNDEKNSVTGVSLSNISFDSVKPFGRYGAVEQNGKWGFIGADGQWLIEPCFDEVGSLVCGLAPIKEGSLWGYVDEKGKIIIEPQFDQANSFNENGIAAVKKIDQWSFIQLLEYING